MHSPQLQNKLIKDVTNFLRTKYEIPVMIPSLQTNVNLRINLKYVKIKSLNNTLYRSQYSPRIIEDEHRYRIILFQADKILNAQRFDIKNIQNFMTLFLQIIDNDIEVMQKNQQIRLQSFRLHQQISYKSIQIEDAKKKLMQTSQKIHDKSDILSFVAVDLKNFMNIVNLISQDCQIAKRIQVYTPLKIDDIYNNDIVSDDDYLDHYQPLLQVLIRLKTNIISLYRQVQQSQKNMMPLKSVNLLANCKNLIVQLQQFLIQPNCAFNRLIFSIVNIQNQNISCISDFYYQNMSFTRETILSVYKVIYCGHLFPQRYHQLTHKLSKNQIKIIDIFVNLKECDIIPPQRILKAEKQLIAQQQPIEQLRKQIRLEKKIVSYGQSTFMKKYTNEKICKKLNLILNCKQTLRNIEQLLDDSTKYIKCMKRLSEMITELPKDEKTIKQQINLIKKSPQLQQQQMMLQNRKNTKQTSESIFQTNYTKLQQKMIIISQIQSQLQNYHRETIYQRLGDVFRQKIQQSRQLNLRYIDLETQLLNSFQNNLQKKQVQQKQAIKYIQSTLEEVSKYLQQNQTISSTKKTQQKPINDNIGYQILNQDQYSDITKEYLEKISSCEYKIQKKVRSGKTQSVQFNKTHKQKQITNYKIILEWLLIIFEGSMDEKVLESMIDRLDYKENHPQSIQKNVDKLNQLLKQLSKYSKGLQKITKQIQYRNNQNQYPNTMSRRIIPKIYKISKERLILNRLLENVYSECLSVYCQLKINYYSDKNLKNKGIKIFDKWTFQYAIVCYQCLSRNRILAKQIQDVSLPRKTHNYINDQIYQPYYTRLADFIHYKEEQLLKLIKVLEKNINLETNLKKTSKQFNDTMNLNTKKVSEQNQTLLKQTSENFLQKYRQIQEIKNLNKNSFMINNLDQVTRLEQLYLKDAQNALNYK